MNLGAYGVVLDLFHLTAIPSGMVRFLECKANCCFVSTSVALRKAFFQDTGNVDR